MDMDYLNCDLQELTLDEKYGGGDKDFSQELIGGGDETKSGSLFMDIPAEMREKIYSFWTARDLLSGRLVSKTLCFEINAFGIFNVGLNNRSPTDSLIPFQRIGFLSITTGDADLPLDFNYNTSISAVALYSVSSATFSRLAKFTTIQQAVITSDVFQRPIPPLAWRHLRSLRILYCSKDESAEGFSLDTLDSLLQQEFPLLTNLCFTASCYSSQSLQSKYAVRIAQFVGKHYRTLIDLKVSMDGGLDEKITPGPGLTPTELANFHQVTLRSFYLMLTEISSDHCSIWQRFIHSQLKLRQLTLFVNNAENLPMDFFCNHDTLHQFDKLGKLNISLGGLEVHFPFDFQYLSNAKKLRHLKMNRAAEPRVEHLQRDVLHPELLPQSISFIQFDGILVNSDDVSAIISRLSNLTRFELLNCGSSVQDLNLGVTRAQIPILTSHPTLALATLDFNKEVRQSSLSRKLLEQAMTLNEQGTGFEWKFVTNVNFSKQHRFKLTHQERLDNIHKKKPGQWNAHNFSCTSVSMC